ncbi:MAG: hypothetical protein MZV65_54485 [Chromatiales bacterium]|nr:hypothetical protein [Chromatiales bacterium]
MTRVKQEIMPADRLLEAPERLRSADYFPRAPGPRTSRAASSSVLNGVAADRPDTRCVDHQPRQARRPRATGHVLAHRCATTGSRKRSAVTAAARRAAAGRAQSGTADGVPGYSTR